MKWVLIDPGRVPYGAVYNVNRPDLGIVATGTDFDRFYSKACAYRKANGIPIGLDFARECQVAICEDEHYRKRECKPCDENLPTERRLTMMDVVHGTKVIAHLITVGGRKLVPVEEANRRGAICNRCKLNVHFPVPCSGFCGELKELIDFIIGTGPRTRWDDDKRSCAICGCFTGSQIRVPYASLEKGLTEDMKKQFLAAHQAYGCWKVPPEG